MDIKDEYTHSLCEFQVDSQEHLNRILEERDRIATKLHVSGVLDDPHPCLDAWIKRDANACDRDLQSMI